MKEIKQFSVLLGRSVQLSEPGDVPAGGRGIPATPHPAHPLRAQQLLPPTPPQPTR